MLDKKYKYIFFDGLGTLFDYKENITDVYQNILNEQLGSEIDTSALNSVMRLARESMPENIEGDYRGSLNWNEHYYMEICKRLELTEKDVKRCSKKLSQFANSSKSYTAFSDATKTLKMLKSKEWSIGVIANWSENLSKLIKDLGLSPSIGFASSSAELRCEKPQRAIFERTLFRAGASADSCLYVSSDFEQNVSAALDSGLNAIWLNRGTNIENERLEGVQIINSLYDVLEVCELTTHDA